MWNEKISIPITNQQTLSKPLNLTLMEEDIKHNDELGTLSYPLSLLLHGLDTQEHHLFSGKTGESIGTILFGATFIPEK